MGATTELQVNQGFVDDRHDLGDDDKPADDPDSCWLSMLYFLVDYKGST